MPKNTAQRRIDSRRQNRATTISGVTLSGSPGSGGSAALAGDGLSYDGVALNVGAGTLLTVAADDIGITAGSTYQFVGTGSGTAAAWQNLSTLAGAGLTHTTGVLAVGAGNGITVNADDVALASTVAGNGLTFSSGVINVAVANTGGTGLTVEADAVRLTTYSDRTGSASGVLYAASGNLKLTTQNISSTIGYTSFTSGFAGSGWRIDYGDTEASKASATFDNLTVRGRMRVYELLIQQIRATNGSALVSSSSKVFTVSASSDPLWTVNGSQLTFNGSNATLTTTIYTITTSDSTEAGASRTHYHGFLVGDLIRAQQMLWDGSGFAGVIQSDLEVTGVTNLYSYTGARVSTASDAPAVGYDYVRIGSASDANRRGVVYLTSDDDNAPFIDIVDGVASHAQWNTAGKIRARLGRLDGITDAEWGTLDGYGLWSDNVYLTGNIYATDGIFNGTVYATDGIFSGTVYASAGTFTGAITANSGSIDGFLIIGSSGGIYQGSGTAASPTTGLKIWNDSGVGRIGGYNSGTLQWYASTDGYLYGGDGSTNRYRLGSDSFRGIISTSATEYPIVFLDTITASDWTAESLTGIVATSKVTTSGSEQVNAFIRSRVKGSTARTTYTAKTTLIAHVDNGSGGWNQSALEVVTVRNGGARYMAYAGDYFYIDGYIWFKPITAPGTPAIGVVLYCDTSDGRLKAKNTAGTVTNIT